MKRYIDDARLVNKYVTQAFSMANNGRTAVDNILASRPQTQNVDDVVKWMFFKDEDNLRGPARQPLLQNVKSTCRARLCFDYV